MASLAEQIRLLSNPEPKRLDLDDDEFDVTRAQVIDKSNKYENAESQIVQSTTTLLKKTVPLLQDEDMKYAGRKISRAQLEASRDDSDSPGFKNGKQFHGDSDGDKHGDSSEDEDVSNSAGNESDVDGIKDENLRRKLTFESSEDNSHVEKEGKSMETGVVLHEGADENDVLASEDSPKGILSFSEDKDSDDHSGNEKNDSDKDEDEDEEEETDSHGDIQNFSLAGLKEDLEKGKAAKNQIGLWDSFLEIRIRFQKALLLANKLPQKDKLAPFKSSGDKHLIETYKQGRKSVVDLLENLLLIQEKLLEENPDTRNVLYPGTSSTNSKDNDDNNEEIPSDSEEEKSANDGDVDREELANGRGEEETLKLPSKRKQTLDASEYGEYICKRHAAFKSYRDATISKWSEKTRLASGKLNSKSFSSFNRSALAQINQILSDKDRLLKRTQLKRSNYRVLGKTEDNETQESWPKQEQTDMHLKDYDAEIFDDDDFYHQLLREFIEQRTGGGTDNPIEMGRQWLQLQRLRRRVRKQVDRKASKGRKIRYDVHPKLVSFMAPIEKGPMVDSSRNELFSSLFGARQPQQESDISVFR